MVTSVGQIDILNYYSKLKQICKQCKQIFVILLKVLIFFFNSTVVTSISA